MCNDACSQKVSVEGRDELSIHVVSNDNECNFTEIVLFCLRRVGFWYIMLSVRAREVRDATE